MATYPFQLQPSPVMREPGAQKMGPGGKGVFCLLHVLMVFQLFVDEFNMGRILMTIDIDTKTVGSVICMIDAP